MSNPSYPTGDRRPEDQLGHQMKEAISRIPNRTHMGANPAALPLVVTHASTQHSDILKSYQTLPKSARPIAPAPGTQGMPIGKTITALGPGSQGVPIGKAIGGPVPVNQGLPIGKAITGHQITSLAPTALKKDIQKVPLSLTSPAAPSVIGGQGATGITNIIQMSSPTVAGHGMSTLHVPNVSSIIRGGTSVHPPVSVQHPPTGFSHLPRGAMVAAASALVKPGGTMINVPRATTPTAIQMPAGSIHTGPMSQGLHGPIRGALLPQGIRPVTPPTNRPASPAVSIGIAPPTDSHRASISLHSMTTPPVTASIQITLQTSRSSAADGSGKVTNIYGPAKVTGMNLSAQPKVVMSHSVTPVMQHPTLAAKANKGAPLGSGTPLSTVTVALSTTTVTIPIISSVTTSSSIPIAKVPPQRQQHASAPHPIMSVHATTHDHRPDGLYPQPMPAHAHAQSHAQTHGSGVGVPAHIQPSTSIFIPQSHRSSPVVSTLSSTTAQHTEPRDALSTIPFFPPYMLSPDNPYYQQLMRYQVAAVAQGQARPGILPTQTTSSLAASLQAAAAHSIPPVSSVATSVRFNPMMVMQEQLRHAPPATTHTQYIPTSTEGGTTTITTTLSDITHAPHTIAPLSYTGGGSTVAAVAAVASSLYTATSMQSSLPQIGQQAPSTQSSTPVNNPSASPRPSILRKRTNEGIHTSTVKKQLSMTMTEVHSPRPEPRPEATPTRTDAATPQSNTSSPKTPASGESQSSTDTALSSDATTPTAGDVKVKTEPPEPHENGFPSSTEASPRKKPRKQLLHVTEELRDIPVTVNDFDRLVEACVKEEKPSIMDDINQEIREIREEFVDDDGIRWTLEKQRPPVSLLNFYNISWKPKNNHFQRYTDVKTKDERRPTVNELSNQKGVLQKASGWKLFHMAAQIEDLVGLERELNNKITGLQMIIMPQVDPDHTPGMLEDESSMLHELTQGNVQRCQLISDQLGEAKSSMLKVLDHKQKIYEIITKHLSKRPIKKKERT